MKEFRNQIQNKFIEMQKTGKLFRVKISGSELWSIYLNSFAKEFNPVFRDPASSEHNCNHCHNFIKRYGNIVAIDDKLNIVTMFDIYPAEEYKNTAYQLRDAIEKSMIGDVFFETYDNLNYLPYESVSKTNTVFQLGVTKNAHRYTKGEAEKFGVVKPDELRTFHHLSLELDKSFVDFTGHSDAAIMSGYRDAKNVFQRGMQEISLDTLHLVRDLIAQGSLLDGQTHLSKVESMILMKSVYDSLPENQRDNWCWVTSYKFPLAKFRNELIGVLCTEIAEGEEINKACQSWNKRVDPVNYMKTKAPISKNQIEQAEEFVTENGYAESFNRRCATIDDIRASEILHINSGDNRIKSISVFDDIKATASRHKRNEFDGVEQVTIEKFMTDILPSCSSVELFLSNSHEGNMVTLTTADVKDSKPIMKWSNNYSWTYNGNLAGKSQIKEAVKGAGGKIDGILRFSLIWNESGKDIVDLDAHCIEPNANHVFYGNRDGKLDVDMINPSKLGVENITYATFSGMGNGVYRFFVVNFNGNANKGFKCEVEFDGQVFNYEYNKPLGHKEKVHVAEVTLKNGQFTIKHLIPESAVSNKVCYGKETNTFHRVNLVCLSPNHWNGNNVGNKHYFFMLEGCKSPNPIRGFHNENLLAELADHRKVLEVLGATKMVESTDKQLSGLGFNATVRDEVILKLNGSHKRMVKVVF